MLLFCYFSLSLFKCLLLYEQALHLILLWLYDKIQQFQFMLSFLTVLTYAHMLLATVWSVRKKFGPERHLYGFSSRVVSTKKIVINLLLVSTQGGEIQDSIDGHSIGDKLIKGWSHEKWRAQLWKFPTGRIPGGDPRSGLMMIDLDVHSPRIAKITIIVAKKMNWS